jgi:hypothetical protein
MEPAATDPMNSDMAADWGIKTRVRDELKLNGRRRSKGSRTVVVNVRCWGWLWLWCVREELVWEEKERSWGW